MFATLRRHQKWLWAGIIAVIIPSFVIFFTPEAALRSEGGESYGQINGVSITRAEYAKGYFESLVLYRFRSGSFTVGSDAESRGVDLERDTRNRVLLLRLLRREKIHVSPEAAAQFIRNAFTDRRQGGFREELYRRFLMEAREHGISETAFEEFAAHQVGVQQLMASFGSNGKLVTPKEAESLYRREHEEYETDVVLFSASNYLASVTLDADAISQYYSNNLARYRIPERVQVKYIRFDLTNYLAEAEKEMSKMTNLSQLIQAHYVQQGAQSFMDTNGAVLPEDKAKAKIQEEIRRQFEVQAGRREASTFATELFNQPALKAENLQLLASNKYTVQITEPFTQYEGPTRLRVAEDFTAKAFGLTEEEPFSEPLTGEDGVYLIAHHRKLAAEYPPLDSIKPRVFEDCRQERARVAARLAGLEFYKKITNSMAEGKPISAVFNEAKVQPVSLPKFSLSTRDLPGLDRRLDLGLLKEIAIEATVGKPSPFIDTRDGGFVLYLRGMAPVDPEKVKKDLPEYVQAFAQARQEQAYYDWLSREIARANVQAPPRPRTTSTN